jgi:Kef-type K+ transport system membrane component KefB
MSRTELGILALSCAAVDDITAWCLLAFIVGVVQATGSGVALVALMTLGFIAFIATIVRPLAARLARHVEDREPPHGTIALIVVAVLAAALTTEGIGVHAIFGAFLLGTVIPHDSRLARTLEYRFGAFVTVVLLPAFFAFTGMRTQIDLVSGTEWLVVVLIIAVATAGKFGGSLIGARLSGLDWRRAAGLGILMNTRGLMELIVLNVGLDLGVISPKLYTMMVLMALATTIATTPVLRLVLGLQESRQPAPV